MGRAEEIFERIKTAGEPAVDEFIELRQSEELYLDFKLSTSGGEGRNLHDTDRNNLAKAISGFGNSEGGVILWGVDASVDADRADVAKGKKPIANVVRFVSWLEGSVSGRTVPPHSGVFNHAVDIGGGKGFVATLILKSELAPHQCLFDSKYYMRAGSSFHPVPHSVLAGMFGRRPLPTIRGNLRVVSADPSSLTSDKQTTKIINVQLTATIENLGPVLARDLYSDVRVGVPKTLCSANIQNSTNEDKWVWWWGTDRGTDWVSQVATDKYKFAPHSFTDPFSIYFMLGPPFVEGNLSIKWTFGCENSPIHILETEHPHEEVENIYNEFLKFPYKAEDAKRFFEDFLKFPSEI